MEASGETDRLGWCGRWTRGCCWRRRASRVFFEKGRARPSCLLTSEAWHRISFVGSRLPRQHNKHIDHTSSTRTDLALLSHRLACLACFVSITSPSPYFHHRMLSCLHILKILIGRYCTVMPVL
ncbi:hypothetical protein AUEXF2481DRAFT_338209 [Aureobasidium subglaciale EXF-2481]|uniref:Uncharacterized protein n=1 Tax=Aureobasidium subglaciale (strain EXF-2481) TaxID=1043005 RepID=A0A074Y6L9_AURSE|nr:uncharacterized protein AUEXF2481DRAFT_338209 [Aureobasidium subglaciale EXF-2481]KEQ93350.1 hypothetical protein AUEXF2481DRAFT_338209 [Aureobasidium subglaciale EXF-2481]